MRSRLMSFFFVAAALIGCVLLGLANGDPMDRLYHIGYFVTGELFVFLYVNYKIGKRHLLYSSVFIAILFLFHYGQLVLYTYFQNFHSHIRFMYLLSPQEAVHGFLFITYSFTAICIGVLVWENNSKVKGTLNGVFTNAHVNWVKVAKTIISYTFFVKVGLDLVTLYVAITAGGEYARIFVNTAPNVILYYGKISLVGFALLIFAYKTQPQKQKRIFIFIEIYILVMMLSGIRSENVAYLVAFLYIYIATRMLPLTKRTMAISTVVSFFALAFIVAVGQFRSASSRNFSTLSEMYSQSSEASNLFFGLLDNCGDTGYTAQAVINNWLPRFGPTYGESYYTGLTAIIPNIPGILDMGHITESGAFAIKLQKFNMLDKGYTNIGGSIIGELFMNFGLMGGVVASLLFGMFIGWIGKGAYTCFTKGYYYKSIIYIPIMLATIYWVRSYFGGGIREAVWGILFAYYMVNKNLKKRAYSHTH